MVFVLLGLVMVLGTRDGIVKEGGPRSCETIDKALLDHGDQCNVQEEVKQRTTASKTVAGRSDQASENGSDRTLKRRLKPCIANPIDSNRLNKRLTSIWGAKRKKVFKKVHVPGSSALASPLQNAGTKSVNTSAKAFGAQAASRSVGSTSIDCSTISVGANAKSAVTGATSASCNVLSFCDQSYAVVGEMKSPEENEFKLFDPEPGSSMVIILKTVARQCSTETGVSDESRASTSITLSSRSPAEDSRAYTPKSYANEGSSVGSAEKVQPMSRDIAERLKARARKGTQQVSCELCGEMADTYACLYRHIKKQHNDCTFVRNYLEEIEPLACTPCPFCKKPFTTPASLNAHIASAHPEKQKAPAPLSKLSVQRHQIAAEKRRGPTPLEDTSDMEADEKAGPLVCKVCGKRCEDQAKFRRHSLTHGDLRFPCEHCDKRFRVEDNLAKHIHSVHGKTAKSAGRRSVAKSLTVASALGRTTASAFKCDQCSASFNRMTLLVTHMRYCLKQTPRK